MIQTLEHLTSEDLKVACSKFFLWAFAVPVHQSAITIDYVRENQVYFTIGHNTYYYNEDENHRILLMCTMTQNKADFSNVGTVVRVQVRPNPESAFTSPSEPLKAILDRLLSKLP